MSTTTTVALRTGTWSIDPAHSKVGFAVKHMGIATVRGNLTLHGVTNEVVLHAEAQGTDVDPWGNERIGLEVTGQLSRDDYGMKFNQALGSGNMLVADRIKLALDISAVKQG